VAAERAAATLDIAMHPEPPPWQREPVVLERSAGALEAAVVRGSDGTAQACAIVRPDPARMVFLAGGARPGAPPAAISDCVADRLRARPGGPAIAVNVPENDPAAAALRGLGFECRLRQSEMVLDRTQRPR
jgi:hypothetical protein